MPQSANAITRNDLDELPDDVRELVEPHVVTPEDLDTISKALCALREEAKSSRQSSGIEATWADAEEAYVGIDDANRLQWQTSKWTKPMSIDGPVTTDRIPNEEKHKSTVFIPVTARYVNAGSAKIQEILLSSDGKSFSFEEMPVPDLVNAQQDKRTVNLDHMGNMPALRSAKPHEQAQLASQGKVLPFTPTLRQVVEGNPAPGAPKVPITVADIAAEQTEIAHKSAKKAEDRVFSNLVKCNYPAEARKMIFDCARIGTGVIKGPIPKNYRDTVVKKSQGGGGIEVQIVDRIFPAAKWVDPWNIFPDPACGERLCDGEYVFERDYITATALRALEDVPGYIPDQIRKAIKSGPSNSGQASDRNPSERHKDGRQNRYEIWYFYGSIKRSELEAIYEQSGKDPDDIDPDIELVYAIVTMVGDVVVRATLNPLESGSIPYHNVPWQRRPGMWAGVGVGEQLRSAQRMANGAYRANMNNAGLSAGPQIIINETIIAPLDGEWYCTPNKVWVMNSDAAMEGQDVSRAFTIAEIPNCTQQMLMIINDARQVAEESTSIPLIVEGQSGETTPQTYGASALQDTNANQLLRSIGRTFDDYLTDPMVRQFYEWHLRDPNVPDDEKDNFEIHAHGSSSLVETAIMTQTVGQWMTLSLNPAYDVDPSKAAVMTMKAQRIDPNDLQYTVQQKQRLAQTPPAPPPQVAAAQLRANVEGQKTQAKTQVDAATLQHEQQKTQVEATLKLHQMQQETKNLLLEYSLKRNMSLDDAKAELAKTAMQLNTEERLNAMNTAVDLHKHNTPAATPPVQAPGRAENGHAFDQSIAP